jgi:hypothetical protein
MTHVTLDRKKALAFLSSFGENVEDLLVMIAGARLTGTIASTVIPKFRSLRRFSSRRRRACSPHTKTSS